MANDPAPTHDLIRVRSPAIVADMADCAVPSWVESALARTPWVVVRRGHIQDGKIPVGVRGMTRSQRFAAWLSIDKIAERRSPEGLVDGVLKNRHASNPALVALLRVTPVLKRYGYRWGPGGSVGFELATATPAVTASSDLDIILRQPHPLKSDEAQVLHTALMEAAAPVRIDAILETPRGGVSLAELAAAPNRVLVRTPDGPLLVTDPWTVIDSTEELT